MYSVYLGPLSGSILKDASKKNSGVLQYATVLFSFALIYLPILKRVIRYFEIKKINRLWITRPYAVLASLPSLHPRIKNSTCQRC